MAVTIYTVGDVEIFRQVLSGVALLFDPGNNQLWSGTGLLGTGALLGMGMLVSFVILMISGTLKQRLNLDVLLILMLVYAVMFVPKTQVQLESLDDGSIALVGSSNCSVGCIPIGIAYPASIISTVSRKMTVGMEYAFTTSDANYVGSIEKGFMQPLKLFLALRQGERPLIGDQYFGPSMAAYARYCLRDSTGNSLDMKKVINSNDAQTAFFDDNPVNALTVYYSPSQPLGESLSCKDAAMALKNDVESYVDDLEKPRWSLDEVLRVAMAQPMSHSDKWTNHVGDAIQSFLSSYTLDTQKATRTLIMASSIQSALAAGAMTDADFAANAYITEAREKWKADAMGEGTTFLKGMSYAMGILQSLFYALSPLMLMVLACSGAAAFGQLGKYLIFGVWTQSWMPVAGIINFYGQSQLAYNLANSNFRPDNVVSIINQPALYENVSTMLATASNMMAATPVITLAVLTGSYFALTSVANRMGSGGAQYFNENAPTFGTNTGVLSSANVGAMQRFGESIGQSGMMGSGGFQQIHPQTIATSPTYRVSDGQNINMAAGKAFSQSAAIQRQASQERQAGAMSEVAQSASSRHDFSKGFESSRALSEGTTEGWRGGAGSGQTLSHDERASVNVAFAKSLSGQARLGGSASIPSEENKRATRSAGLAALADISGRMGSSSDRSDAMQSALKTMYDSYWGGSEDTRRSIQNSVREGLSKAAENNASVRQNVNESERLSRSADAAVRASDEVSQRTSTSSEAGTSYQVNAAELGGLANARTVNNPEARAQMVSNARNGPLRLLEKAADGPDKQDAQRSAIQLSEMLDSPNPNMVNISAAAVQMSTSSNPYVRAVGAGTLAAVLEGAGAQTPADMTQRNAEAAVQIGNANSQLYGTASPTKNDIESVQQRAKNPADAALHNFAEKHGEPQEIPFGTNVPSFSSIQGRAHSKVEQGAAAVSGGANQVVGHFKESAALTNQDGMRGRAEVGIAAQTERQEGYAKANIDTTTPNQVGSVVEMAGGMLRAPDKVIGGLLSGNDNQVREGMAGVLLGVQNFNKTPAELATTMRQDRESQFPSQKAGKSKEQ